MTAEMVGGLLAIGLVLGFSASVVLAAIWVLWLGLAALWRAFERGWDR